MLDLMTLGLSMGAQTELEKMREETGVASPMGNTMDEPQEISPMVTAIGSALSSVETVVCSAAFAMCPSADMVSNVCEQVCVPTLDLSLPTEVKKTAK